MSGESEVAEFDVVGLIEEDVVGFDITMDDPHAMQVGDDADQL